MQRESEQQVSRRDSMKLGAMACTGAVAAASTTGIGLMSNIVDLWKSAIGESFRVLEVTFHDYQFDRSLKLKLIAVEELVIKPQPGCALPAGLPSSRVSLLFEADWRTQLPNATLTIENSKTGRQALLLSQIVPDHVNKVRRFEAIIDA